MEYNSTMKKNVLESFVRKSMHFEAIMLSQINETHELKYDTVLL